MNSATVLMRRIGGGLFPTEARASELVRKIPPHTPVAVRIMRSRSSVQNAYYWRVLEEVVTATGRWRTPEELHNALKVATGHVEIVRLIDGRLIKVPRSTGFDSMSQDEAQHFYDAAFRIIADEIMGGMPVEDLLAHTVERAA
jgi:hypothetical protein